MRITDWHHLIDRDPALPGGTYSESAEFERVAGDVEAAVARTVWPEGAEEFSIYPQSGKARGQGNGVKPIKLGFTTELFRRGWELERAAPRGLDANSAAKGSRPGAFDCHFDFREGDHLPFVVEWETGNVSSSHRAVNRMALGMHLGYASGGILVLPSGPLAKFLTDRIGNEPELRSYYPLWSSWRFEGRAYLGIIAVEHDRESYEVPRIPKGTDGRAAN